MEIFCRISNKGIFNTIRPRKFTGLFLLGSHGLLLYLTAPLMKVYFATNLNSEKSIA